MARGRCCCERATTAAGVRGASADGIDVAVVRNADPAQRQEYSRREDCVLMQQILARDLPAMNLWYIDTLVVHNRRLTRVVPSPSGCYTFLESAELEGC